MSGASGAIVLEVPYNRIPQWLEARRQLDPQWIDTVCELRTQLQAVMQLNVDMFRQLDVDDDLSTLEVAEMFPSILPVFERCGKTGKSLFGNYKENSLRQLADLVDRILANPAIALAESGEKLGTLIGRTIPERLSEVELASKRAAAIIETQEKLRSKHEKAAALWGSECRALGCSLEASEAEIRDAILATVTTKMNFMRIAAEALCSGSIRTAVDIYCAFVAFASRDPLARPDEPDIRSVAPEDHLIRHLYDIVHQPPDRAVMAAAEQLATWPFRQRVICDLLELRAFILQRMVQVASGTESMARFHALALAPPVLSHQCCDDEAQMTNLRSVSIALDKLNATELETIRKLEEDQAFVTERVMHHVSVQNGVARAYHGFLTASADASQAAVALAAEQERVQRLRQRAKSIQAACQLHISALFDNRHSVITGIPARALPE